jgi:hypothetical protein
MSQTAKIVTWVLFAAWAVFFLLFLAKFHSFVDHPVGHSAGGGGGIFLLISQAALGAAVILIWQLRKQAS